MPLPVGVAPLATMTDVQLCSQYALMTALLLITWLHDTLAYIQCFYMCVYCGRLCLICGLYSCELLVPLCVLVTPCTLYSRQWTRILAFPLQPVISVYQTLFHHHPIHYSSSHQVYQYIVVTRHDCLHSLPNHIADGLVIVCNKLCLILM
jgi:hypothetical protein